MPKEAKERRVIYQQRRKQGCCPRCGTRVSKRSGFSYCDDCRKFFRKYNQKNSENLNETRKERYEERKDNNQCPRCGKALGKKYGKTICTVCLAKQYKYNYGTQKKRVVKKSPGKKK